jgi:hypothetical protein
LDEADAEDFTFLLVRDKLGRQDLDDHVSLLLLRIDVGIEIGLTGVDGSLDRFQRVTTLGHVTLDLPGELSLIRDIQIDTEINEIVDTVIVERVETFNDEDLGGLNAFSRVEETRDMIVNGLFNSLARLEGLDL